MTQSKIYNAQKLRLVCNQSARQLISVAARSLRAVPPMADVRGNDCTKKRNAKLRGSVTSRFAALQVGRSCFGMYASVGRFFVAAALVGVLNLNSAALAQAFQPIDKLTTWYTDRNPIDIEIVATTGQGPEARPLVPERILRFRLERAYVDNLFRTSNFSSVSMSFDLPTGLPSSLFVASPEQVELRGNNITHLSRPEAGRRMINIRLEGNHSSDILKRISKELDVCRGDRRQDDLFLFNKDREKSCFGRSLGPAVKYVGQFSEDISLLIECSDALTGCNVSFPFEGFLPSVSFHENHLPHWKEVIEQATAFLQSKEYR